MKHLDHPSPHFNDAKMARFLLLPAFIIALGGRGLIVPFYSVQDCSRAATDKFSETSFMNFTRVCDSKLNDTYNLDLAFQV